VVSQVEQLTLPVEVARSPAHQARRVNVRWVVLGLLTLEAAWVGSLAAVGYVLWTLV
jgi:hypothetical protein